MSRHIQLGSLPPRSRAAYGAFIVLTGCAAAWMIRAHPEGLRAPMWVAMLTCASFVIAGVAIALHPFVSATAYRWFMVLLLAVITAIPLWVAVGHGARSCGSDAGGLSGETSCRVGFGIGAAILVLMLTIALGQALRGGDDPS